MEPTDGGQIRPELDTGPQVQPVEPPVASVRSIPRGREMNQSHSPWYLRKRLMFPLTFVLTMLVTVGWCWWHIPVTNQLTGEREIYGHRALRTIGSIANPKQSLDVAFSGRKQISVLLIGLDHVPATKGDPGILRRSDSVMLAATDFDTKQVRVVSIPRDGWVEHWQDGRNFGYERLASTYSLGQEHDLADPLAGLNRTRESVSRLVDMPVNFYVVIEFEGLVRLIDALGGLDVEVEMDMDYDDNAGDLHVHLKQGLQHLTGEQVVQYARFRDKKLADLGRMPRQQKVVKLVLQELMQARNLPRLSSLAGILFDAVRTNLSLDQLTALAQHMDEYSPDSIQTQTVQSYWDGEPTMDIQLPGIPDGEKRGAQCIFPKDACSARDFLQDLAPPPPPEPEPVEEEEDPGEEQAAEDGANSQSG